MTAGYWQLKTSSSSFAPYKNDVLKKWQDALRERGINDQNQLKVFVAQAMQENGALVPDRIGDNGCSLGLPQRNFCSHAGISAKTAMQRWPEWKDLDYQLDWFAESTKTKLDTYGDIKWAVVSHNCPACANKRYDNGYWRNVVARQNLLEWTY